MDPNALPDSRKLTEVRAGDACRSPSSASATASSVPAAATTPTTTSRPSSSPVAGRAQAEVTEAKMQAVLRSLVIDTDSDHNTQETAKRVAKMFVREVFAGATWPPSVTEFPNVAASTS